MARMTCPFCSQPFAVVDGNMVHNCAELPRWLASQVYALVEWRDWPDASGWWWMQAAGRADSIVEVRSVAAGVCSCAYPGLHGTSAVYREDGWQWQRVLGPVDTRGPGGEGR